MSLQSISPVRVASQNARTVIGVFAVTLGGCLSLSLGLGFTLVCSVVGVFPVATRWWWVGACESSARSGKSVYVKYTVVGVLSVALRGCLSLRLGLTLVCAVMGILAVATCGWGVGAWDVSVTLEGLNLKGAYRSWRTCRNPEEMLLPQVELRVELRVEPRAGVQAGPLGWLQEPRRPLPQGREGHMRTSS